MSIKYITIKKKPTTFIRSFGVCVLQFETIPTRVDPLWQRKVIGKYKRPGRDYKLDVADMVLPNTLKLFLPTYAVRLII
ncbi:MAG: hypothetical protein BGO67_09915 [Alphaproteobacteria bacterium 41-28]|nr:MAG: hypothetical protein BGO67_09915 [Alphaproteobacteria bacterium 41-28]